MTSDMWQLSVVRRGVYWTAGIAVAMVAMGVSASGQAAGADDPTINGFAVEDAVGRGQDVHFKIETDAQGFSISIYRFMNGDSDDQLVATLPAPAAPQVQPPCALNPATRAMDCSNWSESAAWTVPGDALNGTYYALLRRADTGGVNHIMFIVAQ
ncbi:MAG TPA: N,N-dimethylformamidase beta subunit family domain-containing protein [Vicinamibacterales bacterium]|nr:N,N-dimethylformamidase beta subunit family domain-containing protein [Vicinamibacterales bacterium]